MSKFEIPVPGTQFVLKSDSIYTVQPKVDASAPDGFKEAGTTKIISPNIGNTIHAPFNTSMGVWDTGFYSSSPVLRGMKPAEKEIVIGKLQEHIVKPVEEIKGEGILNHQESNNFFDTFKIELKAFRAFNTADPLERLQLYLAVLNRDLAPKEHSSNPIYSKAQYTIVNTEEATNIRQERELEKNEAIGIFYSLANTDRETLTDLLEYTGISNTKTTDKATLNSTFNRWLEDKTSGFQNSKIFINTYNKFKTESGKNELYLYKKLRELHREDLIKFNRGEVFIDGESVGASFKLAAAACATSPQLQEKIAKLVEKLED